MHNHCATSSPTLAQPTRARATWRHHTARVMVLVLVWSQGLLGASHALAGGPIVNPAGALTFKPSVSQAANGTPIINITAPNAGGVSLNNYTRFDVDAQGLILNNSLQDGNALLGAGVQANPNLSKDGRTAQTIVNQVNGAGGASTLAGTVETFGSPATVIIANPNGISCNGCGVLNTPRLSLVAGNAQVNGSGVNFGVQDGQVHISGQGIEGTVGRIDLIGQTVSIQAPVRAHYLNSDISSINILAGSGAIEQGASVSANGTPLANSSSATASLNVGTRSPSAPSAPGARETAQAGANTHTRAAASTGGYAIDASALGAMTAGQIRIISTQDGMGVNLRGPVMASQGTLHISSGGTLSLGEVNSVGAVNLRSQGDMNLTQSVVGGAQVQANSVAGNLLIQGPLQAQGDIQLQAGQDLRQSARLATHGRLDASAGRDASFAPTASVQVGRDAKLQAQRNLQLQGNVQVQDDLQLNAQNLQSDAELTVGRNLNASVGADMVQGGSLRVGNQVQLSASGNVQFGAQVDAASTQINAQNITLGSDKDPVAVRGQFQANARQDLGTVGTIYFNRGANLVSAGNQTISGQLATEGDLGLFAGGNIQLGGTINATNVNAVAGTNLTVTSGASITTTETTLLRGQGDLDLQGSINAKSLDISVKSLNLPGSVNTAGNFQMSSQSTAHINGPVNVGGKFTLGAGTDLSITGSVHSGDATQLQAVGNLTVGGPIQAKSLQASGSQVNVAGAITTQGDQQIQASAGSITVVGSVQSSAGDVALQASSDIAVSGALSGAQEVSAVAGTNLNMGQSASAGAGMRLSATGNLTVQQGVQAGALDIQGGAVQIGADVVAGGATSIQGSSVQVGGELRSGGALGITSTGGALTVTGPIQGGANVQANAQGNLNLGAVSSQGTLQLNSQNANVQAGNLLSAGSLNVGAAQGITAQTVSAQGPIQLSSGSGALHSGAVVSNASVSLQSGADITTTGPVVSATALQATALGNLTVGGSAQAGTSLTLSANRIQSGSLQAGQGMDLSANTSLSTTGDVSAQGNLTLRSGADTQIQGQLLSGQTLDAQSQGALRAQTVYAGTQVLLSAGSDLQTDHILTPGQLQASAGNHITSSGNWQASRITASATAGNLQVTGAVSTPGAATLSAGGNLQVGGALLGGSQAAEATHIQAGGSFSAASVQAGGSYSATTGQDHSVAGALTAQGNATITAGRDITTQGAISTPGQLQLSAGRDIASQGKVLVLGDLHATSTGKQTYGDAVHVGAALNLTAGQGASNTGITIAQDAQALGGITIDAGRGGIQVGSAMLTPANITLAAQNTISVGGNVQAQNLQATSSAAGITLGTAGAPASTRIDVLQNLNLQSSGDTTLHGTTTVQGNANAQSSAGSVRFMGALGVQGSTSLQAQTDVVLGGDTVLPGAFNVQVANGQLRNSGHLQLGQALNLNLSGDFVNDQIVETAGAIDIRARNISSNTSASGGLYTQSTLKLDATGSASIGVGGTLSAAQAITLGAASGMTNAGTVQSGQSISFTGSTYTNSGATYANTISVTGALANQGAGSVIADTITVSGTATNQGQLGATNLTVGGLNNSGTASATQALNAGATSNSGSLSANTISLGSLSNSGSVVSSTNLSAGATSNSGSLGAANININGGLSNGGSVSATGSLNVGGGNIDNTGTLAASSMSLSGSLNNGGTIAASGNLSLGGGSLTNSGSVSLSCTNNDCSNPANQHWSGGGASISAASISGNFNDITNSGVISASGDVQLGASGGFTNSRVVNGMPGGASGSGGAASGTVAAGGVLTLNAGGGMANSGGAQMLSGAEIRVQAASFTNTGTVYGAGGPVGKITVQSAGAISNGADGILIAGSDLQLSGSSFTNAGGTVGSFGNATLATPGALYAPGANPLIALGAMNLQVGGISVNPYETWTSAASSVSWSGTLDNYGGSVYFTGAANGNVNNRAFGSVTVTGTPPSDGSYQVNVPTPPPGTSNWQIIGYTDVERRAFFGAASLNGNLTNEASDVNAGGAIAYNPVNLSQTVTWKGKDALNNDITVDVADGGTSLARIAGNGPTVLTLTGPNTGTITGGNVTINAGSLTLVNGASAQTAVQQASNQSTSTGQVGAGVGANNAAITQNSSAQGHAGAVQAIAQDPRSGAPTVGSIAGLPGASDAAQATPLQLSQHSLGGRATPSAPPEIARDTSAGQGRRFSLEHFNIGSAQGAAAALWASNPALVLPQWDKMHIVSAGISAKDLTLNLSGTYTNRGTLAVDNSLTIRAAGGIDNSGAALQAGGIMQLYGGGLNNPSGTISAQSLWAELQGDVNNDQGSITVVDTAQLQGANVNAVGGNFSSTRGSFVLLASGDVNLTASTLSASNGLAAIQAKGNVTLGTTTSSATQTTSMATPAPAPTAAVVNDDVAAVNHAAFDSSKTATTTTTVKGSVVEGNAVVIQAGRDVDATAAQIAAKGAPGTTVTPNGSGKQTSDIPSGSVTLLAGGNINLRSGVNTTNTSSQELHIADTSNSDAARSSASGTDTRHTLAQTTINANNTVLLQADKRVDLSAVRISGDKGVGISAKEGIALRAIALNNQSSSTNTQTQTNSANDIDGRVNTPAQSTTSQAQSSLTHAGSSVTAQSGNVTINAANNAGTGTLTIESSNVKAGGNVNLQGQDIAITALQDRSQSQTNSASTTPNGAFSWTTEQSAGQQSARSSGASIQGGGNVSVIAVTTGTDGKTLVGGNATLQGANVQAGGDLTLAGANVRVSANVDSTAAQASTDAANSTRSQTQTAAGAQLQAGGKLDILAQANAGTTGASQGNIVLNGATVSAGAAATLIAKRADGQTQGQSGGGTISLGTVTLNNSSESASASSSSGFFSSSSTVERHSSTDTLQKGTTLTANSISANASGDINATNAQLGAVAVGDTKAGAVELQSQTGNVTLAATTDSHTRSDYRQTTSSGLFAGGGIIFGSRSSTDQSSSQASSAGISSYGGDTVLVASGKNITLSGTNVISDNGTRLSAKQDITIDALMTSSTTTQSHQTQQSGLGTAGIGLFLGNSQQKNSTTTQTTTANGSTVAAVSGNVTIDAGATYTQTASNLQAPAGDITVTAKKIDIQAAQQTQTTHAEQSASSAGVSLTISNPVVSAVQGVNQTAQMAQATANVNDARMKALGAATTALSAANTATQVAAIAKDPSSASSIGINISLGSSNSQATQDGTQTSSAGSSIAAGGNVKLTATGAGQDSNITLQGSTIDAGKDVSLKADNQVNLLAATNTATTANASSSSGSSLGVGFTVGSKSGFNITASANQASGSGEGSGTSYTASSIKAGTTTTIQSGGDTNIIGSTVAGNTVKADVGGNLTITSLQDKNSYTESSQSSGAGVSLCVPPFCYGASSANVSAGKSAIDSNYQSTTTTAGIKAGDGGFTVDVKGASTLTGGQITSTQAAVDANKNSYASAGGTTTKDLQNSASYNASSMSVSAGMSGTMGDQSSPAAQQAMADKGMTDKEIKAVTAIQTKPSGSAGVGRASGNAASTTAAGITGIAGNKDVRTGDADASLKPIFDATQVRNDVTAQTQITASFGQMAPKAVGDYADRKLQEAINNQDAEGQVLWKEGGSARVALHTFVGGLSGGTPGAVGAATSQTVIPLVNDMLKDQGLPEPVRQGVVALAGAGIGAATGGTTGAATGFNATVNNYLSHPERVKLDQASKSCYTTGNAAACATATALTRKDQLTDQLLANAVATCTGSDCNAVSNFIYSQMVAQGCTAPSACPDATALSTYWTVAQKKAQGLEPVYPEGWILDAKALVDLGRFGVRVLSGAGIGGKGSLDALAQLSRSDASTVANNFYRDGVIADPSKAMSATGPWKSVAELTPQEANTLIASRLPASVNVTGTSSADVANAASIRSGYQAPFIPGTNVVEVVTAQPSSFVRVYVDTRGASAQTGSWVMRAEDIAGLTPQQIASKFSLPQVPTMVTDVTVPVGVKLEVSAANSISPGASRGILTGDNVGGGGVQFQIPKQAATADADIFKTWFTNPRPLK